MHNCKAQFVTYPSIGNNNAGLSDYSLFQVGKIGYMEDGSVGVGYKPNSSFFVWAVRMAK